MLSLEDNRALERCEDYYLAPPEDHYMYEIEQSELEEEERLFEEYLAEKADREVEDRWFQKIREGL